MVDSVWLILPVMLGFRSVNENELGTWSTRGMNTYVYTDELELVIVTMCFVKLT